MKNDLSYKVVLAKLQSEGSGWVNWDLTDRIAAEFDEEDPAYELASQLNDDIPEQHSYEFRYLVITEGEEDDEEKTGI